jgi:hypothetical protein
MVAAFEACSLLLNFVDDKGDDTADGNHGPGQSPGVLPGSGSTGSESIG